MKIIGNPDNNKLKLKNLILNLNIDFKYLKSNSNFRKEIIDKINSSMTVLDIGKSMREDFKKIKGVGDKIALKINKSKNTLKMNKKICRYYFCRLMKYWSK